MKTPSTDAERVLTDLDCQALRQVLRQARRQGSEHAARLSQLERQISRAQVVAADEVPSSVVTMNSRVRLADLDTGQVRTLTVVYPALTDTDAGRVSVLAPLGTAVLGCRAGDEIDWKTPSGRRRLRVEQVLYQPEARGHFHL